MMYELAAVHTEEFYDHAGYDGDPEFSHCLISRRLFDVYNSNGRDVPDLTRNYSYNPGRIDPRCGIPIMSAIPVNVKKVPNPLET